MRLRLISVSTLLVLALSCFAGIAASACGDNIEAQLVWGTNEEKPPDSSLHPIGPNLSAKLKNSPFKWEHYFQVKKESAKVPVDKEKSIAMSKNCEIKITNLGTNEDCMVKLELWGKGKLVNTVTQSLPKGQLLIVGGNAENATAWFVVVRRADE